VANLLTNLLTAPESVLYWGPRAWWGGESEPVGVSVNAGRASPSINVRRTIGCAAIAILLGCVARADGAGRAAHSYGGLRGQEPFIAIHLSSDTVVFKALAGAELADADREIEATVDSNLPGWQLTCRATGLQGESAQGELPADRVFVRTSWMPNGEDEGGGAGYLRLAEPRLVLAKTDFAQPPSMTVTLQFRLRCLWSDRPGSYRGSVNLAAVSPP